MLHPTKRHITKALYVYIISGLLIVLGLTLFIMYPRLPSPAPGMPHTTDMTSLQLPPGLYPGSDFTISMWIQLSRAVLRRECAVSSSSAVEFVVLEDGRLELSVSVDKYGDEYKYVVQGHTVLKRGQWYHIAASYSNRGGAILTVDGAADVVPYEVDSNKVFGTPVEWDSVLTIGACKTNSGKSNVFGGRIVAPQVTVVSQMAHEIRAGMFELDGQPLPHSDIMALKQVWQSSFAELYSVDSRERHEYQPVTASPHSDRRPLVVLVPVYDTASLKAPEKWIKACHKPHENDLDVDLVYWHVSKDTIPTTSPDAPLCFNKVHHLVATDIPTIPATVSWFTKDKECWLFYSMFLSQFLVDEYQYVFVVDHTVRPIRTGWLDRMVLEVTYAQPIEDFWVKGSIAAPYDPEHSFVYGNPALYILGDSEFNTVIRVVYERFQLSSYHGGGARCGGCYCGPFGGPSVCIRKYLMSEEAFATSQSTMHLWRHHDLAADKEYDGPGKDTHVYFVVK